MREFEARSALTSNQHDDDVGNDVENDGDNDVENDGDGDGGGDDDKDDGGGYGNETNEYRGQTSCSLVYLDCSTVCATNKQKEVADI